MNMNINERKLFTLLAVRIEKRPFNACVLWLHLLPTLRLRSCFSLWQSS